MNGKQKNTLRYYSLKTKKTQKRKNSTVEVWEAKLLFKAGTEALEINGRVGNWRGILTRCEKYGVESTNPGVFILGV